MAEMPFVSSLVQEDLPVWQQCLDTEFLRRMEDGTLALSYSKPDSFTHYNTPTVSYVPFVMIGKYHEVDGRVKIPITTEFHHAVNDGYHAEQFFHLLEDCCREF